MRVVRVMTSVRMTGEKQQDSEDCEGSEDHDKCQDDRGEAAG